MTINRTSNALWRGPAVAEVKLSPDRWLALSDHGNVKDGTIEIHVPTYVGRILFLPAVYRLA